MKNLLTALWENSEFYVLVLSKDLRLKHHNSQASSLFLPDWTPSQHLDSLIEGEEADNILDTDELNALNSGKTISKMLYRVKVGPLLCFFVPQDDVVLMIGVNLSTVTTFQALLKREESYFYNLINAVPAFVFWKDKSSTFLGCNNLFAQAAGFNSPGEIVGKTDFDLPWTVEESQHYVEDDEAIIKAGVGRFNIEEEQTTLQGEKIILLTSKFPLTNEKGEIQGLIGVYSDITARKKAELELLAAKLEAERSSAAKTRFIATMNHDLRVPLTGMLGMGRRFLQISRNQQDAEDARDLCFSAVNLLKTINDILAVSKMDSGKEELEPDVVFDLNNIVEQNVQLNATTAKQHKLALQANYAADCPRVFRGKPTMINRMIINLVSNALKFTDTGSVTISVERERPDGVNQAASATDLVPVAIHIIDTGNGIPEDKQEEIFGSFSKLDHPVGKQEGTGIGLYEVKHNVERLGGQVSLKSKEGSGSTFTLHLPLQVSTEKPTQIEVNTKLDEETEQIKALYAQVVANQTFKQTAAAAALPTGNTRYQVLLVEDERLAAKFAKSVIEELDAEVELAESGKAALALLKQDKPYDVIFVDFRLPDMQGTELTEALRKLPHRQHTQVVGLSGHEGDEYKRQCYASGMNEFITKPMTRTDVENVLKGLECSNSNVDPQAAKVKAIDETFYQKLVIERGVDLMHDILKGFQQDMKKYTRDIAKAIEEVDIESAFINVHKLYGTSTYCPTPRLTKCLGELHNLLIQQKNHKVVDYWEFIEDAFELFCDEQERFLKELPTVLPQSLEAVS